MPNHRLNKEAAPWHHGQKEDWSPVNKLPWEHLSPFLDGPNMMAQATTAWGEGQEDDDVVILDLSPDRPIVQKKQQLLANGMVVEMC